METDVLKFFKYSGNGNDFIILDRPLFIPIDKQIRLLCDRHFGVGADGVLTLYPLSGFDGEMGIFNADGGEAEMCGNGLRCLVTYMDEVAQVKKDVYVIKTLAGTYNVSKHNGTFAVEMTNIKDKNLYDLSGFKVFERTFFINTGVPHLVFLTADAKAVDICSVSPRYRHHSMFPEGTNVNYVEVLRAGEQSAYVRTYERGVENETFSCGTGLTASALALHEWLGWQGTITLMTLGGMQTVDIGQKVLYSGEVRRCFEGQVEL